MWSLQISVNLSKARGDLLHQTTNFDKFVVSRLLQETTRYKKRQISINLS
jgi:hypothetical protein